MNFIDVNVAPAWGRRFFLFGWCLSVIGVTFVALLPQAYLQLPVFSWWDKLQHAMAFTVLTSWALLLWPLSGARVVLGMLVFGGLIELMQWSTGWRFGEWADWVADTAGVLFAYGLISVALKIASHREQECQ